MVGIFPYHAGMEKLCEEIEAYAEAHNLTPATVVRYAVGANAETWGRWLKGDSACSIKTANRVRRYLKGQSPKYAPKSREAA